METVRSRGRPSRIPSPECMLIYRDKQTGERVDARERRCGRKGDDDQCAGCGWKVTETLRRKVDIRRNGLTRGRDGLYHYVVKRKEEQADV